MSSVLSDVRVRTRVEVRMDRIDRTAQMVTFSGLSDGAEHFACVFDGPGDPPLVRMHSECMTGDVFGSARCDCGPQLDEALRRMAGSGGILLYLRQEGRGIGFYNKMDAYALQDRDVDTFRANELIGRGADERDYRVGAEMLEALGVDRIRLLTNNPDKIRQLRGHGVDVVAVQNTLVHANPDNARYLEDKAALAGHQIQAGLPTASVRIGRVATS